jgi:hypothetical protein
LSSGGLISKVRNLRNKLEHYYKVPADAEVEEAIEIAELFILSIESKTKMIDDHFIISSGNFEHLDTLKSLKNNTYELSNPIHFKTQLFVNYISFEKKIILIPTKKMKELEKIYLDENDSLFYYFIRLINHLDEEVDTEEDLKLLLTHSGHPMPSKNIKIAQFY